MFLNMTTIIDTLTISMEYWVLLKSSCLACECFVLTSSLRAKRSIQSSG